MAIFFPSISTVVVQSVRWSDDFPMLGNGVGTNGAGGAGILQTFGNVAAAMSLLPSVTGVLGGLTATEMPIEHLVDDAWLGEGAPRSAYRTRNWPTGEVVALAHIHATPRQ